MKTLKQYTSPLLKMNKYLLLACLFGLSSCKGVPAKPVSNETYSAVRKTSPQQKTASPVSHPSSPTKRINTPAQNLPFIYGNTLFYWKTPLIDQKLQRDLYKVYHDSLRYDSNEQKKRTLSYFNPLVQALSKRNPEKDAKAFLAKKQRFLLGRELYGALSIGRARTTPAQLSSAYQVSEDAIRKCAHISKKKLQGLSRTYSECYSNGYSICQKLSAILDNYYFRWNRVMLKDCEKH